MNGMLLGDRFVLEREIGSGGMARVFLGRDSVLDRPVAIKVLNPGHDETDIGSRFRREGRTAARLSHPNIVQVFDAGEGELDGKKVSYIVMEYVSGGDLKDLIDKQGSLQDEDLARLGAGAAAGLAHAHERGVIHRDVKPHNVLIDAYGEPKLTDFGIARALDATTSQATKTGSYLGTALYSAPEQLQGQKVTPKSDVYSLGVTLYQAAAGNVPFLGTPMEVAGQHIHQPPVPPKSNGGGRIDGLILDCLSKDPDARPTAAEVHERLKEEANRIHERAAAPPPPAPDPRPTRQTRPAPAVVSAPAASQQRSQRRGRGPLLLGLAALLLVLLGLAVYAATRGTDDPGTAGSPQPNSAREEAPANNGGQGAQPAGDAERAAEPEQQPQERPVERPQASAQEEQQDQQQQETPPARNNEEGADNPPEQPAATPGAGDAEQAVEDFYASAASGDYETSAGLLSVAYQQNTWSSPGVFEGTFNTLERIEFTDGPTAEVNGNTATVFFSTNAYHSYGLEQRTGSAILVQENGAWKIDDINV